MFTVRVSGRFLNTFIFADVLLTNIKSFPSTILTSVLVFFFFFMKVSLVFKFVEELLAHKVFTDNLRLVRFIDMFPMSSSIRANIFFFLYVAYRRK